MAHEIHNLISVDEIKHCLRITSDLDNNLFKDLLEAAIFHLEAYLSRGIIHKVYKQVLTKSTEMLKYGPILEIQNVRTESGKDINYTLEDTIIEVGYLSEPIIVQYRGGLFDNKIPPEIKVIIMEIISSLYNSEPGKISIHTILNQLNTIRSYKL